MNKVNIPKSKPLVQRHIRFTDEQEEIIGKIAKKNKATFAKVVRFIVDDFLINRNKK